MLQLNEASDAVTSEMHQLDHAVDSAFEDVNRAFQAIIDVIEQRRETVISNVKKMRDEKKKVLQVRSLKNILFWSKLVHTTVLSELFTNIVQYLIVPHSLFLEGLFKCVGYPCKIEISTHDEKNYFP